MSRTKKRFIAGAVCPRCGELDKIRAYRIDDKDYRECVACDFQDEMRFKPVLRELDTRVAQKSAQAEPVKILSPPTDDSEEDDEA